MDAIVRQHFDNDGDNDANAEVDRCAVEHLVRAESMLALAGIHSDTVRTDVQALVFSEPLLSDDYRLVELDTKLAEAIQRGQVDQLYFRGDQSSNPVLCSATCSYDVKEAETSNTLLVLPQLSGTVESDNAAAADRTRCVRYRTITSLNQKYLELTERKRISLASVRDALEVDHLYAGPDNENWNDTKGLSETDLLAKVQGSHEQLVNALKRLPVCLVEGVYRWLDTDYVGGLVSALCDIFEQHGGTTAPANEVARRLVDNNAMAQTVADFVIRTYTAPHENDGSSLRLLPMEVCVSLASALLRPTSKFAYDDFVRAWQRSAPVGVDVDLRWLHGVALVDDDNVRPRTVQYLAAIDLPEAPAARFAALFSRRQRWRLDDIAHYLDDCGGDAHTLILKHCRTCTVGGVKFVQSRC